MATYDTSSAISDGSIAEIDALLSEEGIYHYSTKQVADLRMSLLRQSVDFHLNNNRHYSRYAERMAFDIGEIVSVDSLASIPMLPSSLFKSESRIVNTLGHDEGSSIIYSLSSGTQGNTSRVPRNDLTLMRFFATMTSGLHEVIGLESFSRRVYHLGPKHEDAPQLWTSYAMAGAALLFDSTSYVTRDNFDVARLIADLRDQGNSGDPIALVGPPPLLLEFANTVLTTSPLQCHPESVVIAFGGWKRKADRLIDRCQFDRTLADAIGHEHTSNIRDVFNMVELNTVVMDCTHKRKHCPPWLHVLARNPKSLEPSSNGESGILAYFDPTATSYPCFILSDDFGSVDYNVQCECGRTSDVLHIERRINRLEARGCALKLDLAVN